MIEKFEDLDLLDEDKTEDIDKKIQEKLGLSFKDIYESFANCINSKSDIIEGMINIAPYNDYEKLIEDDEGMINFLRSEAVKEENWELKRITCPDKRGIQFKFNSIAVDDGTTFEGVVWVSFAGKIKHVFCYGE